MTIKELINELNELIINGDVNEDAIVTNAELDDIFSVIDGNKNRVIIYF